MEKVIVVKIGGVALGTGDTTIEDIVSLQQQGKRLISLYREDKPDLEGVLRAKLAKHMSL